MLIIIIIISSSSSSIVIMCIIDIFIYWFPGGTRLTLYLAVLCCLMF